MTAHCFTDFQAFAARVEEEYDDEEDEEDDDALRIRLAHQSIMADKRSFKLNC